MTQRPARLAVDIGGTFTDVVLDLGDRYATTKRLTTYTDPAQAVLRGIETVLTDTGTDPAEVGVVLHGTTLATNALIGRSGAKTGLLTTAGHRDALEMAFENRFEQYDVNVDRPVPLVPRHLRLGVTERMSARGGVLRALDESSVVAALETLCTQDVESLAVCLLHGYVNAAHEQRIAELAAEHAPDLSVTLASDVCPEIREFERTSTTCANAYVRPLMARYLASLERQLTHAGVCCPCLMMTSGGGLTTIEVAGRFPIRLVESGPAGGALLAAHIARRDGLERVVSFDMGGTTAKICLIDAGQPQYSRSFEVDRSYRFKKGSGLPVRIPVIEMVEIGAGGGSIAGVDRLGRVQVGPASAGSEPGPAAYGRGGEDATVSDADTTLGYLLPRYFGSSSLGLDADLAMAAIERHIGVPLGVTPVEAARSVAEIVNENMAAAARAHAAEWGRETSGRTLVAFGGAAPLHAAAIADKLRCDSVVVPNGAGVGSAVGFLIAPVAYEVVRSRYLRLSAFEPDVARSTFEAMRAEASEVVSSAAPSQPVHESRRAFMRYVGQGYEIAVDVPETSLAQGDPEAAARQLREAFEAAYETLYGRTIPGLDVEVLSWTLTLGTAPGDLPPAAGVRSAATPTPERSARVFDLAAGRDCDASVWRRDALPVDEAIPGPVLIVDGQTTVVVSARYRACRTARDDIVLTRIGAAGPGER